jgi:hypothetical protein
MKKPNETAVVKVLRDGKEYEFNITLRPVSRSVSSIRSMISLSFGIAYSLLKYPILLELI